MTRTIKCPHCTKKFADNNAIYTHLIMKHGGKGKSAFAHQHDESYADMVINASLEAAMGGDVPEYLEEMFPDEIERGRRNFNGK